MEECGSVLNVFHAGYTAISILEKDIKQNCQTTNTDMTCILSWIETMKSMFSVKDLMWQKNEINSSSKLFLSLHHMSHGIVVWKQYYTDETAVDWANAVCCSFYIGAVFMHSQCHAHANRTYLCWLALASLAGTYLQAVWYGLCQIGKYGFCQGNILFWEKMTCL